MIQEFCDFCRRPILDCSCPKPFIILSDALFDLEQDKTAAENQQAAETVRHRDCRPDPRTRVRWPTRIAS